MDEPRAPIPPYRGTEYFTLGEDLKPHPCSKAEWVAWSLQEVSRLAVTSIGDTSVVTEFPGFLRAGGGDWFFETVGPYSRFAGADTYEDAMQNHEAMVAEVPAEMAKALDRTFTPDLD